MIIFFISIVFFNACKQKDSEVSSRLNNAVSLLKQAQAKTEKIDFEAEKKIAYTVEQNLEFIEKQKLDSFYPEMGFVLSDYKSIIAEEAEEGNRDEHLEVMLKKELNYTQQQLSNLKHDFSNNQISKIEFNKYFYSESTAVSNIYKYITKQQTEFLKKQKLFNELNPKIEALIDSLKK